jgi:hypothetical protein
MADLVYLTNARLSFPQLVEARSSVQPSPANPNPAKKFSADFILSPTDPAVLAFMTEYGKAAVEKWGEHAQNVMALIQNDRKLRCYGNGNEKINNKTFVVYDGYANNAYITASSDAMPQMIQANGVAAESSNIMACQAVARKLYGGCYVNVALRPWLQDNKHGRAVRCELIAIQFAADGDAFGEAPPDLTGKFGAVATPTLDAAKAAGAGMPALPSFMG